VNLRRQTLMLTRRSEAVWRCMTGGSERTAGIGDLCLHYRTVPTSGCSTNFVRFEELDVCAWATAFLMNLWDFSVSQVEGRGNDGDPFPLAAQSTSNAP
jgi:hypothetical protein